MILQGFMQLVVACISFINSISPRSPSSQCYTSLKFNQLIPKMTPCFEAGDTSSKPSFAVSRYLCWSFFDGAFFCSSLGYLLLHFLVAPFQPPAFANSIITAPKFNLDTLQEINISPPWEKENHRLKSVVGPVGDM